jgi:hypothetical protein
MAMIRPNEVVRLEMSPSDVPLLLLTIAGIKLLTFYADFDLHA